MLRYGEEKVKTFEVTRGDIPVRSVTSTYMIDDETGYIKIKNFGANTYAEMLIALAKLSQEGFSNLVIDFATTLEAIWNQPYRSSTSSCPQTNSSFTLKDVSHPVMSTRVTVRVATRRYRL